MRSKLEEAVVRRIEGLAGGMVAFVQAQQPDEHCSIDELASSAGVMALAALEPVGAAD